MGKGASFANAEEQILVAPPLPHPLQVSTPTYIMTRGCSKVPEKYPNGTETRGKKNGAQFKVLTTGELWPIYTLPISQCPALSGTQYLLILGIKGHAVPVRGHYSPHFITHYY